jgi:adenylyltransferase/sulfurtransferase
MRFHEFRLQKNPDCPLCGERPVIRELIDYEDFCGLARHRDDDDPQIRGVSAVELHERLKRGDDLQIVDVRLPHELELGMLPGALSIPMSRIFKSMDALDPSREAVLVCKKGENSAVAIHGLLEQGYAGPLLNLEGGMNAWARDVDPSLPEY